MNSLEKHCVNCWQCLLSCARHNKLDAAWCNHVLVDSAAGVTSIVCQGYCTRHRGICAIHGLGVDRVKLVPWSFRVSGAKLACIECCHAVTRGATIGPAAMRVYVLDTTCLKETGKYQCKIMDTMRLHRTDIFKGEQIVYDAVTMIPISKMPSSIGLLNCMALSSLTSASPHVPLLPPVQEPEPEPELQSQPQTLLQSESESDSDTDDQICDVRQSSPEPTPPWPGPRDSDELMFQFMIHPTTAEYYTPIETQMTMF